MKQHLSHTLTALFIVLLAVGCTHPESSTLSEALRQLDKAIALRNDVAEIKETKIEVRRGSLRETNLTYAQRIELVEEIIEEYSKYQLDSTITWLEQGIALARKNNDHKRVNLLTLQASKFYSAAGFYNEAATTLDSVDTLTMDTDERMAYYLAAYSFNRETREYSPNKQLRQQAAQKEHYYINRLVDTATDSLERHKLLCTKYFNESNWEAMNHELDHILPTLSPDEQEFAYFSYFKAIGLGNERGSGEAYMTHLAQSARADMRSATTDHGSLSLLSEILFYKGDIERAFGYIQIALQDATFYNSRLRPWQVASMMPLIERNYRERIEKQQDILIFSVSLISLLLVAILLTLINKSRHARQLEQAKTMLEQMNKQLDDYVRQLSEQNAIEHQLSAELSEANTVKEQYIGLFLVICSNYIDLLKSYHNNVRKKLSQGSVDALRGEIERSRIIDEAEEEFYANFDNAFLSLYPTFVEEFNSLLKDECRISLKNPRQLNTELRIVALIKLGISDSSRIASLLRYSVNTIYNYRSGMKNKAKVQRDDFEENIRNIGSLKSN